MNGGILPLPSNGAPGTRRVIKGQGGITFDVNGQPDQVWTRYGHDAPNPWLNKPMPNVTYYVGANLKQLAKGVRLKHIYRIASDGTTASAEAVAIRAYSKALAGERWQKYVCQPVASPGGEFDRGHLIAAEFGVGMESINLVTMPASVNRLHRATTAMRRRQ